MNYLGPNQYMTSFALLTSGTGASFNIQDDGNCVAYRKDQLAYWATNTSYSGGTFLIMQDDGNLCLYKGKGPTNNLGLLWASNTSRQRGPYVLCFQSDGSLQIYKGSTFAERHDAFWISTGWAATTPRCTIMNVDSATLPSQKFVRPVENAHDSKIVHVSGDQEWCNFIETRVTDPKDGTVKDAVIIQNLRWGRILAVDHAIMKNGQGCVNTEIHCTPNELWFKEVLSSGQVAFPYEDGTDFTWNADSDTVVLRSVKNSDFVFRLGDNGRDTMIEVWKGTNLQKWTVAKVNV